MFFGYTIYPDTYFLDKDKERLEGSPFFEERRIRTQGLPWRTFELESDLA
jgi:hypothetical protein